MLYALLLKTLQERGEVVKEQLPGAAAGYRLAPPWLERRLPHFNIERPEADDEAPSAIEDERETVYR